MLSGQVKLSGTILANPAGQPDDVLIAAGQVVVTGPVTSVGYAQVIVAGQLVAPAASRDVLEPRLQAQGQSAWYRSDDPRIIIEDTRLGPDFFRLLDHPVSLVVLADLSITPGVTEAALGDEPGPAPPSAATAVIAAERVAIVGEAIRRLPEQQRTTLAMAAAGELTSAEIAAALGVPAGTVRYRLSLARRALAAALASYDRPATREAR